MSKSTIQAIALILSIVGGLNWGLVGVANLNLVTLCFGNTIITKIVYGLVGLSAIYTAIMKFKK